MNTLSMPLASLVLLLSLWGCRGGDAPLPEDDPEDSDTSDTDDTSDTSDTDDTSTVVTYPGPEGVAESNYYAVSVEQEGTSQDRFVSCWRLTS